MDTHVRVLGILHIVFGAICALIGIGFLLLFGGIASIVGVSAPSEEALVAIPILGIIGTVLCVLLLVISLPGIIAGYGLLKYRQWARILALVLSAIELLNVPLGTVLGVYGLWVLLNAETERLFQNPPLPR